VPSDDRPTWVKDLVFRLLRRVEAQHRKVLQAIVQDRFEDAVRLHLKLPAAHRMSDADWLILTSFERHISGDSPHRMRIPDVLCVSFMPLLARCRNLEQLDLSGDAASCSTWDIDAGLRELPALPRLTFLNLSNTPVTAVGIRELVRFPKLERLGLYRTQVGDEDAREISRLPQLCDVWMNHSNIGDAGVGHLIGLPRLRRLVLSGTQITDQALTSVSTMSSLEHLDLESTTVTSAGLAALQSSARLQWLSLSGVELDETGPGILSQFPALKSLNLTVLDDRVPRASPTALGDLGQSRSLETLILNGSEVSTGACRRLAQIHTLCELQIFRTNLTDEALLEFIPAPSLVTINARQTQVTPRGAAAFRDARPDCQLWV